MPDFSNLPFRQQIDHVIRFKKIAWAKQPWNSLPPQINLFISVSVKQKFGASPMLDPYSQAELVAFDGNRILLLRLSGEDLGRPSGSPLSPLTLFHLNYHQQMR